jgi:hypothetical protein
MEAEAEGAGWGSKAFGGLERGGGRGDCGASGSALRGNLTRSAPRAVAPACILHPSSFILQGAMQLWAGRAQTRGPSTWA